ncbi:signal peptidase II [Micromonospora aurantiaca (nom. illeg.)]|uniref:signal peptidase II n=1 Tax=Micromonospora aurantiaca (nom. illeg.) TaxID=47850 RepID=UPI003791B1BA
MTAVQAPPQRVAWLAGAAMTALAVDVASKSAAAAWLPGRSVDLFAGLALRLTRNPGAAFSIGTGITPVFTVVTVAVIAGISWYGRRVTHRGWAVALGLVAGGAAGNLVDRLFRSPGLGRGHVVDFLHLDWWPTFNLADTFLICGVAVAVWLSLRNVPVTVRAADDIQGSRIAGGSGER